MKSILSSTLIAAIAAISNATGFALGQPSVFDSSTTTYRTFAVDGVQGYARRR